MTDTTFTTEDHIRYTLGATGENAALLTTLEVQRAISLFPDEWRLAAALLAEQLAAQAVNDPNSFGLTGSISIAWGDRARVWMDIAKSLRKEVAAAQVIADEPSGIQSISLHREFLEYEPEYGVRRMKKGWR